MGSTWGFSLASLARGLSRRGCRVNKCWRLNTALVRCQAKAAVKRASKACQIASTRGALRTV